ncbi:ABC transporter ATP-binding protein [Phytohabitans sp. ZYX-F-186]|uniref:ABC transporter ATP-binding protein n=1 Tax=Phytohabitans maris TaxID=3071409 RepID=A0ABU0ZV48_9ACTN|nr:ABC transporter ATP-binding protein [Phytohabitans sp. ZYX-F-186]MDQ7910382.1 ABC transporter ATP-binding protein [Phytohabitans sp. ZYX-F-186]
MSGASLRVEGLTGHFRTRRGAVPVLDDVSFTARAGQVTAIVGETGSGKSLTALSILRIAPPEFVVERGRVLLDEVDLLTLPERRMRAVRGARVSMVFQDARAALNPVLPVGRQLADVCRLHRPVNRRDAEKAAVEALAAVQIPDAARRARQYPHEFSGGMAQRALIAMALICEPEVVVFDEPTTGLDVTIQAEIMALIGTLTAGGLTALLITHDLGVVAETCAAVVVMRDGRVVEEASTEDVFTRPRHPYTAELLAASRLVEGSLA